MNSNVYRNQHSCTTIVAIENQLTAALRIDLKYRPGTTINTKYGVLADVKPTAIPRIQYFGIGINGCANITSTNNIAQPYNPKPTQLDLYEPMPFRCVREPLDDETAKQYVIRQYVDGWYKYWLKKIEFESNTARMTKIVDETEEQYTIDKSALYPVPTDLYPTDISKIESRVEVSVTGVCKVTGEEVTEVINALYGGDMRRARISEIGTYSGIPYKVGEDPVTRLPAAEEAIYVQLCTHKCTVGQVLADASAVFVERKSFANGSAVII